MKIHPDYVIHEFGFLRQRLLGCIGRGLKAIDERKKDLLKDGACPEFGGDYLVYDNLRFNSLEHFNSYKAFCYDSPEYTKDYKGENLSNNLIATLRDDYNSAWCNEKSYSPDDETIELGILFSIFSEIRKLLEN